MVADLWTLNYDGILRICMPDDTFLVRHADDLRVVIRARTIEERQMKLNQVIRRVGLWLEGHGLQLAIHTTEIVLPTRRRADTLHCKESQVFGSDGGYKAYLLDENAGSVRYDSDDDGICEQVSLEDQGRTKDSYYGPGMVHRRGTP